MNNPIFMANLEVFIVRQDLEGLYCFRNIVADEHAAALLVEKLDKLIIYRENRKYATHEEFNRIMDGNW